MKKGKLLSESLRVYKQGRAGLSVVLMVSLMLAFSGFLQLFFINNANAAALTEVTATLSSPAPNASSSITIKFVTPTGISGAADKTLTVELDTTDTKFQLPDDINFDDVDVATSSSATCTGASFTDIDLSGSATTTNQWKASFNTTTDILTLVYPGGGTTNAQVPAATCMQIEIGSAATASTTGVNFTNPVKVLGPAVADTYTIAMAGTFGDSGNTTVAINDNAVYISSAPVPVPALSFSASPISIVKGQSLTLTWSAANVSRCWTTDWSGTVASSGSQTVTPTQSTAYNLNCSGPGGSVTKLVAVTVGEARAEAVTTMQAAPTSSVTVSLPQATNNFLAEIPFAFRFQGRLKPGTSSDSVKMLQTILNSDSDTKVAEFGPGSKGNETNYFGALTKKAVIRFQEKYTSEILSPWQLTKGTGFVGETTQAKLNRILGR